MENKISKNTAKENNESINLFKFVLLYPLALLLLFEEWGWEPLATFFERLAKHPLWARFERQILLLPPWSVLFVFGIPVLALLPLKFFAVYLFGKGHFIIGGVLLLSAKIFGTAICARIFQLTKPTLMKIDWFSRFYPKWKNWKDKILGMVRSSGLWHLMQKIKLNIKTWWKKIHLLYR